MATANKGVNLSKRSGLFKGQGPSDRARRPWGLILLVVLGLLALLGWYWREPVRLYTKTGASYGARTVCSCRHVANRTLEDCQKDFEPGMEIVFVSEDVEARSVTARVPLLARQTATFRPGYGCVLESWER